MIMRCSRAGWSAFEVELPRYRKVVLKGKVGSQYSEGRLRGKLLVSTYEYLTSMMPANSPTRANAHDANHATLVSSAALRQANDWWRVHARAIRLLSSLDTFRSRDRGVDGSDWSFDVPIIELQWRWQQRWRWRWRWRWR